ncbi:MAG TPA: MdtA/MuxA family multidrug efflux RND transporter periplasmic adaptor subunit [Magnetospirillaceae bacterium]|nr:MdtA/MuxA family multidrug efflux RND transporter periplasmic adaptor subunit [Magnetospirillaceae bacterium]
MHEPHLSAAKPTTLRRRLIWGAALVVVAGAIAWVVLHPKPQTAGAPGAPPGGKPGGRGAFQAGPMPVVAASVTKANLDVTLNALGTVTPLATVTVKTQIAGTLMEIGFQEGQMVKKGDFLAQIDPRPYEHALEQAQGQLAKDQALLKQAQLDLKRYKTLLSEDSIASQQVDTQDSLVEQYKGTVITDQANVGTAKLNLIYCHITAPVTGRVGLRQVDLGNYVQTSDTNGLVVITQMQPMSVVFTLPEDQLPQVLTQTTKGNQLKVTAYDRAKTLKLAEGKLDTIDNQIDSTTGTVKLRALFANDPQILYPQQFVNVDLLVNTLVDAKTVPTAAVQNGAPGAYVYLVKDDNTVTVRPVKVGPQSGDKIAILSGLEVGDKVVVDGADKLREGSQVTLPAPGDATAAPKGGANPPSSADDQPHRRRDKDPNQPAPEQKKQPQ